MRNLPLLGPVTLLLILVSACSGHERDSVIRIVAFAPSQGWTVQRVFEPWTTRLDEALGKEVDVQFFAGGTLGRHPFSQLDAVKDRIVDAAYIVPGYTPGAFPDNDLFEIPGLLPDIRSASIASWRLLQLGMLRGYHDLHVLALFTSQPYYLHLRDPVASVDQLPGKKIRITGSIQAATVTALGAVPIGGIAAPQLADSIDKGIIDGALFSWDLMQIYGVTDVTSYHIDFPLGYINLMVAMNRDSYEWLSERARVELDELSGEPLIERFVTASTELAELGFQSATQSGRHQIVRLSATESAEWRQRLTPLLDRRKKSNPRTTGQLNALNHILDTLDAVN